MPTTSIVHEWPNLTRIQEIADGISPKNVEKYFFTTLLEQMSVAFDWNNNLLTVYYICKDEPSRFQMNGNDFARYFDEISTKEDLVEFLRDARISVTLAKRWRTDNDFLLNAIAEIHA